MLCLIVLLDCVRHLNVIKLRFGYAFYVCLQVKAVVRNPVVRKIFQGVCGKMSLMLYFFLRGFMRRRSVIWSPLPQPKFQNNLVR
jgi:hypothetical protein